MHLSVARVLIPGRADGGVAGGAGGCAAGAAGWWGLGAGESPQETPPLAGRSLLVAEAGEAVMADYATLLRDHVTLSCRSVDRIFLQAYVPKLQTVGWVCQFLRWQRGYKIPRSAAFGRIGAAYVAEVYRWAKAGWCWSGWRRRRRRCGGRGRPRGRSIPRIRTWSGVGGWPSSTTSTSTCGTRSGVGRSGRPTATRRGRCGSG